MKIVEPSVELLSITKDPAQLIERAGRTCYKSEDRITSDSANRFVGMIVDKGHHSVIEHASATFRIVTDRGVTHELVRHRLASYSQESTRYCNYGKEKFGGEITVIQPPGLDAGQLSLWRSTIRSIESVYLKFVEEGVSPQIARSILPNCLKTEIVVTANLREWIHIIKLRTSSAAHPQIRQVIGMVQDILVRNCPEVFDR